MYHNQNIFTL